MEVYVRENLHVLDYDNNIVDTIFNSDDHITAGYAYDITITEANTGYSDLKFNMPNIIHTNEGETIKNPKLALLTPLVKLRYNRQVYYMGDKPITVREPEGYGDTTVYVDKKYSNRYPENIIEDYIMDYIVQPVDKKRDVLKLNTTFTAIDYPRFNLSKKRVGLTIDDTTVTKDEWSLYENKPLDNPGTIKYQQWTAALSKSAGNADIPLVWDPENARQYPLNKTSINTLMGSTADWPYGLLATAFYWPIVSTARFEGRLYKKGGYLVLHLFDFYSLTTEGVDPDLYIGRYSWEWSQIYEIPTLLCPNNAKNYLHHILEGTNWTVAKRPDGTDDVDIIKSYIPNPKGSTSTSTLEDDTCNIHVSGSNCYNAITEVCKGLQLYPIFDCEKRTVALRQFAGKNYGLTYALGKNLSSNGTKLDGEKVITKLYCTGGKDYQGDENASIGYAERTYLKTFTGFYRSTSDLPKTDVEGYWAVVDSKFATTDFQVTKYRQDMTPYTATVHDSLVKNYWVPGTNRQVYFYKNGTWTLGTKLANGNWSGTVNGVEVIVDPITGTQAPWDPNDDMYIFSRSPYGTNYILNLRWAYQNNWITKEQILELYQYELQIHDLDYMFMDGYTKDRIATQQAYTEAVNNYDVAQDEYQSTLYAMENKYYNVDKQYSEGYTYCFHVAPQGTYSKYNPDLKKNTSFIKLFHCYTCGQTVGIAPNGAAAGTNKTKCPYCNGIDITNDEIYIPTFGVCQDDFKYNPDDYPIGELDKDDSAYRAYLKTYGGYQYNPHMKGYWQRLVMSMDRIDSQDEWDIHAYESRIKMIVTDKDDQAIPFRGANVTYEDGYNYKIEGVYVKSVSGQIEVWNESVRKYTTAYGNMLDYLREVNACLARIEELQALYDAWKAEQDRLHAVIQEKFGDYIVEGNYVNSDQPFAGLLFKEGLEASDKFSIPEVTYTLDVIDSTGLIEYRQPRVTKYICAHCGYTRYTPMYGCPKCDSDNILAENDTYNDLVRMLHSVGQIVPKAGDYVSIYDEPMGMFGVPGLITEISRNLDNPVNNKIKLDTGYTDDEELVGNIITATNTVLSNADIYARTSILKADGTLDADSVKNSLDNSNADITIVGTNGSILLNGSGLRCTDPTDPKRAMKYAGNGIFSTTNLGEAGEPTIWEKMMTPEGINATYIRSGSIDTNKLTILSGLYGKAVLDQYGFYVKTTASRSAHVTKFDWSKAKTDPSYGSSWGSTNNIASFIGVDTDNDPLIYTKGFLYAEAGSNIAGWITDKDGFYHLNSNGKKDLYLSPTGIWDTVFSGTKFAASDYFSLYSKGNFGVTRDGKLYAKDGIFTGSGEFTGYIMVTDDGSQMNKGTVGGFQSGDNGLSSKGKKTIILSPGGYSDRVTLNNGKYSDGLWAIYSLGNMGVTTGGVLWANEAVIGGTIYATDGEFNGTIYAKAGKIGDCEIEDGRLVVRNANIETLSVSKITSGVNGATMTFNGSITCNNITARDRGNIAGWEITSNGLKNQNGNYVTQLIAPSLSSFGSVLLTSDKDGNSIFTIQHDGDIYWGPVDAYGNGCWASIVYNNSHGLTLRTNKTQLESGSDNIIFQVCDDFIIEESKSIRIDTRDIFIKGSSIGSEQQGVTGYVKFSWGGIGAHNNYLAWVCGILVYAGESESDAQKACGTKEPEWEY